MSQVNIIRAWKDEEYRQSLTEEELAALPENPAGLVEQAESVLRQAEGGYVVQPTLNTCFSIYHCFLTVVSCPSWSGCP
jgi:mersacidin/lichenicidin family type 2 lantibiotic